MMENLDIIYTAIENISSKEFSKKIKKEISALANIYGTQKEIIRARNVLELIEMGISEEEIYNAVQMHVENKIMKKPRKPRNPRCHYKSIIHYTLGIISPSLVWSVHNEKTEKYWKKMEKYKLDMIRYKIEKRSCTREEYKALMRHQRTVNS